MKQQTVSQAPARLCLLGEHQDYFGLSVISCAMDLYLTVRSSPNNTSRFEFDLPDVGARLGFGITDYYPYLKPRDYLRSAIRVAARHGCEFATGFDVSITSRIPIAKGNSSSSALTVGWLCSLMELSSRPQTVTAEQLAEMAYEAEVAEFAEPGGKQDHYAISCGGIIHLSCEEPVTVRRIERSLSGLLLVDSGATKDTQGVLSRIKAGVTAAFKVLQQNGFGGKLSELTELEVLAAIETRLLKGAEARMLLAVVRNRDITRQGYSQLTAPGFEPREFGRLINRHYEELRDGLQVSTPRIERLITIALDAGAFGCKVNGSGGGGCFLAYAPEMTDHVRAKLVKEGAVAYPVRIVDGARILRK